MNITSTLAAAAVAGATLFSVAPAHANTTVAPIGQWESPTVNVFFRNVGAGWQPDEALAEWNASGVVNLVRVYDPSVANIKVRRSANMPAGYAGYALWDFGRDETGNFNGYFTWCSVTVEKATAKDAKAPLLLHELGHCIGLTDNYAAPEEVSVMSYDDLYSQPAPTQLDYATLQFYYSQVPSYWTVPATTTLSERTE
jgi:hypothetical protein